MPYPRVLRWSDFQVACSLALRQIQAMDRSVVAKATSSDDSPTPGYLFIEIAQMTHANFEGCRQLTIYLLERIKKPNHNVKFKCLQIIKVFSARCRHGQRCPYVKRENNTDVEESMLSSVFFFVARRERGFCHLEKTAKPKSCVFWCGAMFSTPPLCVLVLSWVLCYDVMLCYYYAWARQGCFWEPCMSVVCACSRRVRLCVTRHYYCVLCLV